MLQNFASAGAATADSGALAKIRQTLRTDVIALLSSEISELQQLDRDAAYDLVMSRPHLLNACFGVFREQPVLFRPLLIDPKGRPVVDDAALLSCGRSVSDVVALVVRASAKRYFRAHADLIPDDGKEKGRAAADRLYEATSDYLRFEWQCPLIPAYVRMPIPLIDQLGERLLDFRESAELLAMAGDDEPFSARRPPLLLDSANRALKDYAIDPDVLWKVGEQMDIVRLYPELEGKSLRPVIAEMAIAQPKALKHMMPVLGNDIRRFCVFLFVVHAKLGDARYKSVFGENGQSYVVEKWMDLIKRKPQPAPTLAVMTNFYLETIGG
jgi:hypothetical protein